MLNNIAQHEPNAGSLGTTSPFTVWQDIGRKDQVVSFRYLPSPSYGCELQLDYQPGHNAIVDADQGDPTLINVWRLSDGGNFPYTPTWNNTEPRMGPLVGTFHFPSANALNTPEVVTIATFVCDSVLTFRFSVALDNARGGVSLDEDSTSGLRIAYNC
jgi:hypothetical protein